MKAEIKEDGCLRITAETPTEAAALKYLFEERDTCKECDQIVPRVPFVIDYHYFV